MPTAWRIVKEKQSAEAFSGEGARLFGGRWNSPGTRMVYTSESSALVMLEMLVHLDAPGLLHHYGLISVEIDAALVVSLERAVLPENWKQDAAPFEVRAIGDLWAKGGSSVALAVPSALVPGESNFLLNPAHPGFSKLRIGGPRALEFDPQFASRQR